MTPGRILDRTKRGGGEDDVREQDLGLVKDDQPDPQICNLCNEPTGGHYGWCPVIS